MKDWQQGFEKSRAEHWKNLLHCWQEESHIGIIHSPETSELLSESDSCLGL